MLLLRNEDEPGRLECGATDCRSHHSTRRFDLVHILDDWMNSIEEEFLLELAQIQSESIGLIPLDEGAYLHVASDDAVIQVVGIAKAEMAGGNVLWLI
jgi:hypothetical protein